MRIFSYLFSIILVVLTVSFSVLNSQPVLINYFIGQKNIYFPLLLFILLFLGVIIGVLAMLPVVIRLKIKKRDKV